MDKGKIGKHCFIHESAVIECEDFELGDCGYIGPNTKITCKSFKAKDYFYMLDGAEIGRGGCFGPNSIVDIGRAVFVGERAVINPSEKVTIGDEVGIGTQTQIWTHGAYLDYFQEFPAAFESVTIGDRVWLPTNNIVLPGVTIGNDVVVSAGSLVNRNLPPGCLAGGSPAKMIRRGYRLGSINADKITRVLNEYKMRLLPTKIDSSGEWNLATFREEVGYTIMMSRNDDIVARFHYKGSIDTNTIKHDYKANIFNTAVVEDFRDFLRRYGVRFLTGKPFRSIRRKIKD